MVHVPLAKGIFITGTDTGVGKTVITAALTAALRSEGMNAGIWKPVQTGALPGAGITDAERLARAASLAEDPSAIAPLSFEAPLAPAAAARQAGRSLKIEEILAGGRPLAERYDALLVEGAGGAAVPLTEDALTADLIEMLGMPALIVARSGLGTVNHTLLTYELLRRRGIPVLGAVLNDGGSAEEERDPSVSLNAELIEQFGRGLRVLGRFPRIHNEDHTALLIRAVRQTIDLAPVREALAWPIEEEK